MEAFLTAEEGSKLNLRWFYIPGWKAEINGIEIPVKEEPEMRTILITIPKDVKNAKLKIYLPLYIYEKLGYLISAISLLLVLAIYFRKNKCRAIKSP